MAKKWLIAVLVLGVICFGANMALAYHFEFNYSFSPPPNGNYAYGTTSYYTDQFNFNQDIKEADSAGTATVLSTQPGLSAGATTRPINSLPINQVDVSAGTPFTYYNYAYAYSDSFATFVIVPDAGDPLNPVEVKFDYTVNGTYDIPGTGSTLFSYFLKINNVQRYSNNGGDNKSGAFNDDFSTTLLLDLNTTYNFQLVLDGSADYSGGSSPNTAQFQADLQMKVIPTPATWMLFSSGLLGLPFLRRRS